MPVFVLYHFNSWIVFLNMPYMFCQLYTVSVCVCVCVCVSVCVCVGVGVCMFVVRILIL